LKGDGFAIETPIGFCVIAAEGQLSEVF
jgi:hypothetical protein